MKEAHKKVIVIIIGLTGVFSIAGVAAWMVNENNICEEIKPHPESLNISFTTDGCIMAYPDGTIMEGWYTNKTTVNMSNKSEVKIPCITQFNKNSSAYQQHIKVTRPPKNNSLNIYFKYYSYVPVTDRRHSPYYSMYYDPEITVMLYGIDYFGNLCDFGEIFSVEDFEEIGHNSRFDIIIRIPENSILSEDYNCSIELQIKARAADPLLEVEPRYYEIEVRT